MYWVSSLKICLSYVGQKSGLSYLYRYPQTYCAYGKKKPAFNVRLDFLIWQEPENRIRSRRRARKLIILSVLSRVAYEFQGIS